MSAFSSGPEFFPPDFQTQKSQQCKTPKYGIKPWNSSSSPSQLLGSVAAPAPRISLFGPSLARTPAQLKEVMIPASTKEKKGSKKKGGTQVRQGEVDRENQLAAGVERQIQEEGERAREVTSTPSDLSGVEEMKIGDTLEQGSKTVNGNSSFSFEALHPPRIEPVTPTKFSENSKFLKKSINDLSFMPEPIVRKNSRTHHFQDSSLFTQILSKLDMLSETVESQTAHIVALEKRMEELTFQSKRQTQANKANRGATKKIETMADRVAAMAATFSA